MNFLSLCVLQSVALAFVAVAWALRSSYCLSTSRGSHGWDPHRAAFLTGFAVSLAVSLLHSLMPRHWSQFFAEALLARVKLLGRGVAAAAEPGNDPDEVNPDISTCSAILTCTLPFPTCLLCTRPACLVQR